MVKFYLMDARKAIYDKRQAIQLYGRTKEGSQICVIDASFLPYFYVLPKQGIEAEDKIKKLQLQDGERVSRAINTEKVKKKLLGKEKDCIKVYVQLDTDIKLIVGVIKEWEFIEGIFEQDIAYVKKYITEKHINFSTLVDADVTELSMNFKVPCFLARNISSDIDDFIISPRILSIDIETYNKDSIDMKKNPIIMVAFYGENFQKVITWKRFKTDLDYVEFVASELELIERSIDVLESYQPDIITGYNSDKFDFPYIEERAKKYRLAFKPGLDKTDMKLIKGDNVRVKIPGIVHFDIFRYVKSKQIEGSLSLDNVSKKILGKEKKKVDLGELYKVWDLGSKEISQYCEYNLEDAKLCYELAANFMPEVLELSRTAGMTIDNITRIGFSQIVESFLIREAHSFEEFVPNKPSRDDIAKRFLNTFKGSFVFEPVPGLYDDIMIFDFKSLYPSIIASHNISLDTQDCDCCDKKENISPEDETEHHYCSKKKGFLSLILENLIARRSRLKKESSDSPLDMARSETLKLLANSFYGYLGFYGARWYSIESANAVTAWGRHYILKVIGKATREGFKVIYSDTDSIFISLEGRKKEAAMPLMKDINSSLPGVMELEYEGFYKRGMFVSTKEKAVGAKKKYALLTEENSLKVRGFESVRGNFSEIGKKVQREVLLSVLKQGNAELALDYVKKTIEGIEKKDIKDEECIIETTLQKDVDKYDNALPHVVVAKRMQEQGKEAKKGTKIRYIVAKGEGRINERAKLPQELEQGGYDSDYYINNQVLPSVEKIFELFDISKEEILGEAKQKKLGEF